MDQGLLKLVSAPSARDGGGGGGGRRGGDGGAGGGMQLPPHSLSSGLDSVDEVQEEKEEDEWGAEELEEELRHRMAALALALASCPNAADAQDADPHMHGSGAIDSPAPFAHDISCSGANCVPLFFLLFPLFFLLLSLAVWLFSLLDVASFCACAHAVELQSEARTSKIEREGCAAMLVAVQLNKAEVAQEVVLAAGMALVSKKTYIEVK